MNNIKFRYYDKHRKTMGEPISCTDAIGWEWLGYNAFDNPGRYTVMQFTGLHDLTRREIYEDDILKVKTSDGIGFFQVVYVAPKFMLAELSDCWNDGLLRLAESEGFSDNALVYERKAKQDGTSYPDRSTGRLAQTEIIGNVHQNPEFLTLFK